MQKVQSLEHSGLVYKACEGFRSRIRVIEQTTGATMDDLHQVSMEALIEATNNYEEGKGKFSVYAYRFIQGRVQNYVRDAQLVRMPRDLYDSYNKVTKLVNLENLSIEEACKMLGLSEEQIKKVDAHQATYSSLDEPASSDDEAAPPHENTLSESSFEQVTDRKLVLMDFLKTLTEEEKEVWFSHHSSGETQSKIAAKKGTYLMSVQRMLKKVEQKAADFGRQQGLRT